MQDARVDEPSRTRLEPIGFGEIENPVIALIPVLKTSANLRPAGARLETHERVGKIVAYVVVLRRKVVRLRLAFLPHQGSLSRILMHVMRNWSHVVEKLRIDWPSLVFVPDPLT